MATTTWEKDDVQFPRLIAELWGVGLTRKQIDALAETMDLKPADLTELFDRADKAWQKIKDATPAPNAAPEMRCKDCNQTDPAPNFVNPEDPDAPCCPFCKSNDCYLIPADDAMVKAAQRLNQRDGELEIDEGAVVSRGEDTGAYVAAWVWVDDDDVTDDDAKGGD